MGQQLKIERIGRTPVTAIELVESPDDGGFYLGNTDFQKSKRRTSVKIYRTREAAIADWQRGTVEWEGWR